MQEVPRIISVDDHVVEPPDLWTSRLPSRYLDIGPRVERRLGFLRGGRGVYGWGSSTDAGATWADCWVYEDAIMPLTRGFAHSGFLEHPGNRGITFDDMLPGCYQQNARLADMDVNHTDASMCFPTFSRFCGQRFATAKDRDLALLCVHAYNDFMIDQWCGGEGRGRLIPLTIVPLWDADLAAAEVLRCAEKGSHSVAFSEAPYELALPSIHAGFWDPFLQACEETDTVINMHIGSSGQMTTTSDDAPRDVVPILNAVNSAKSFVDWMVSGHLAKHPRLRIAFSEGQVGWMPFYLERITSLWNRHDRYGNRLRERMPDHPREYMRQIYGCIYDDLHGLQSRDVIGMEQIMFETDYPHADSTFPDSKAVASKMVQEADLSDDETIKFLRGNAIRCYGLDRYFGVSL